MRRFTVIILPALPERSASVRHLGLSVYLSVGGKVLIWERALLCAAYHFEGTFVRGISF